MVPASVIAAVQALASAVTTNAPLKNLPRLQLGILQTQAAAVVAQVDAALLAAAGALDAPDPTGFPGDLVNDLVSLNTASDDQTTLADVRGLVGRATFNINQVFN